MASMIDKTMEMTLDEEYEDYDLEDLVAEACLTYETMGQLFTELLSYHAGRFDDEATKLITDMMREHILETM